MSSVASWEDRVADAPSLPRRVVSSPAARLLASRHGIDLARVRGTGPKGRVIKHDVMLAAASPGTGPVERVGAAPTQVPATLADVPRSCLSAQFRVDRLVSLLNELNEGREQSLSVNDLLLRAAALALREVPAVNVAWSEGETVHFDRVDLAMGAPARDGLRTPIIRDAASKGVLQISAEARTQALRACAGQLREDESRGGSFGVSILGMFSVDEFAAIANPPQAGILAVGAVRTQTAATADGQPVVGKIVHCTLSVDRRVVNNALASTWLAAFGRLVESPVALLI